MKWQIVSVLPGELRPFVLDCTQVQERASGLFYWLVVTLGLLLGVGAVLCCEGLPESPNLIARV